MTSQEHTALQRYFDQLKGNKAITAQDIRDAVAATGTEAITPALLEYILLHAESFYQIDAKTGLSDLYAKAEAGKAAAAEREHRANVKSRAGEIEKQAASLAATAETLTPDELTAALAAIGKEAAGLITTSATVNRFPTWRDYEAAWQKDTDRDFSPALFDCLPFPEGTVSYIGARTGRGKTTAMVNIGIEALFPQDRNTKPRHVLFVSLEESHKQIIRRFSLCLAYRNADLATRAQLDTITNPYSGKRDPKNAYKQFKRGKDIDVKEYGKGAAAFIKAINEADAAIKKAVETGNLVFFDGIGAGFSETIAAVRSREKGDIVLLDYIQKIPCGERTYSGNPDLERICQGSGALIAAAIGSETVVIAGAQFNREGQKGSPQKDDGFTDADFRGCGDLEQDGHNLLGIGRSKDKAKHYYGIIKSREGEITDKFYAIDFAGGYSYMARGNGEYTPPLQKGHKNKNSPTRDWTQPPDDDIEAI